MKLLDIAKETQDLINDGIKTLAIYKVGRSWKYKELCCCDFVEDQFTWVFDEEVHRQEVLNIIEIDSNALIVNGYNSPYVRGSIQKIYESLKYAYDNKCFLLSNEKEDILQIETQQYVMSKHYPKDFTVQYIIPEIVDYLKSKNKKEISMRIYYESDIADYPELKEYHKDDYDYWLEDTNELIRIRRDGDEYIQLVGETVYEEKERFVRTSLKSLLLDISKNILDVYYKHQDGEEIVTVAYTTGSKYNICVNGDSLLAIINDVTKRLLS